MEDEERLKKLEAGKAKVGGGCGATGAGRLGEARSARLRGAAGLRRDWAAGPACGTRREQSRGGCALRRAPGAHPAPAAGSARLGSAGPQVSRRGREVAARGGAGKRADRDTLPSAS